MEEQRVITKKGMTRTVSIFPWGNGHRVKYTCTTTSIINSLLVAACDEYHEDAKRAEVVYNQFLLSAGIIRALPDAIIKDYLSLGPWQRTDAEMEFAAGK